MSGSEIDRMIFAEVVKEWQEAPYGMKGEICKRRCALLDISQSSFYRKLDEFIWNRQKRKSPSNKGKRKNPEREKWVWEIMQIKYAPPPGVKPLSTRDALQIAVERGLVPPEAKEIHRGTIDRISREKGWGKLSQRQNRYMAEFPNQIHQFAIMQSKHFFPIRKVDGEWILIRSSKQQKIENDLIVFVYALADDYSGYRVSKYAVGQKDASDNGISFLQWAWSKEADHMPFHGLPNILFMGKTPLASQDAFRNFCSRMGVEIRNPSHDPGIPKSLGKIAQTFRSIWNSFENQLFSDHKHEREISIT